jgi:tRNA (guanine-N7-)-methyltransferase
MRKVIRTFVRRNGRKLSNERSSLLEDFLPHVKLDLTKEVKNLSDWFGMPYQKYVLEIGFGTGDNIFALAQRNPSTGYLGAEPYVAGVAKLLQRMHADKVDNIRVWDDDAHLLLDKIPNNSLAAVYVLHPDPWPKKKHHKRRIINDKFLALISEKLNTAGDLFIATDHAGYAEHIKEVMENSELFSLAAGADKNYKKYPDDWVKTKYHMKAQKPGVTLRLFHFASG